MRGALILKILSGACLGALNEPRNVAKGDWLEMTWEQIDAKLAEEFEELRAELWRASQGKTDGLRGILTESPDLANICAMAMDKALQELGRGK